jgi:oxalate---CoA ligase
MNAEIGQPPRAKPQALIGLLQQRATLHGDAIAIVAEDRAPLSYAELLVEVDRVVRVLTASGVKPNDRVSIVSSSGPQMVVLFLAVSGVAACAPLNPSYTATEFEFYLRDLAPRVLIVEKDLCPRAVAVARQLDIPTLEFESDHDRAAGVFFFHGAPEAAANVGFAADHDTALVLHTSGTTGRPKMVPLTQRNLSISALNIARSLALTTNDRCLSVMPLFHIHGLVGAVLATIFSGGSLACPGAFRSPAFAAWMKAYRPTWYTAAPSIHAAVLARASELHDSSSLYRLRFIRSCSAPLPPRVIAGLERIFDAPVLEAYGMTEAAHQMVCNPLPPGRRKPGSVGIATGTEIGIMNNSGDLLPPGVEGEIGVRGESVMGGYLASVEVNEKAFTNGWFRTGDQGWVDEDGYVFITGRIKEMINRGGEKISPREVDEVLLSHPKIAEALTFAVPDARLGEEVGAAIVPTPDAGELDTRSILTFAETKLAPFKLPRRIVFVAEIPKGPTGKPQRVGLAKRLGLEDDHTLASASSPNTTPTTPTEKTLLRLCCDAFQLKTIGIHDDFFDSGGDSLSAMRLLCDIERHWNIILTIADLLGAPTIASFAKVIDGANPSRNAPRLAPIQDGGNSPAFFCINAGPGFRQLARLLGPEQPFLGTVHPNASTMSRPCRIEDIAAYHVQIIRNAQPTGPYYIGGFCNDGVVAYEVAQQLHALGERVGLLVLFDASFYSSRFEVLYGIIRTPGEAIFRAVLRLRPERWGEIPDFLRNHIRYYANYISSRLHPTDTLQEAAGWREIDALLTTASRVYRPLPYYGRVLSLNRSAEQSRWSRRRQDWSRVVTGPLDRYEIACSHYHMFDRPYVFDTAEKLGVILRNAQSTTGTGAKEPAI